MKTRTNKQWIFQSIAHEEPAAVPYNFMFSPPAQKSLEQHYGHGDLDEFLGFPIRMAGCNTIKPLYADPDEFGETIADEFGVIWTTSKINRGAPIVHPLTTDDLSGYKMPDPQEHYRFEGIDQWCGSGRFRSGSPYFCLGGNRCHDRGS